MSQRLFSGSVDSPIAIKDDNRQSGLAQRNAYLSLLFGRIGINWRIRGEELFRRNGRRLNTVHVWTPKGAHDVIFDITSFKPEMPIFAELVGLEEWPLGRDVREKEAARSKG